MTAGVVVLCMPAVAAIIRRWYRPVSLYCTTHRGNCKGNGLLSLSSSSAKRHSDAETANSSNRLSGNRDSSRQGYALQDMFRGYDRVLEETRLDEDDVI